jgi:hypothetical protein
MLCLRSIGNEQDQRGRPGHGDVDYAECLALIFPARHQPPVDIGQSAIDPDRIGHRSGHGNKPCAEKPEGNLHAKRADGDNGGQCMADTALQRDAMKLAVLQGPQPRPVAFIRILQTNDLQRRQAQRKLRQV